MGSNLCALLTEWCPTFPPSLRCPQDFFQAFAWTESGLDKQVERRNRQLLDPGSSSGSSGSGWPGLRSQARLPAHRHALSWA